MDNIDFICGTLVAFSLLLAVNAGKYPHLEKLLMSSVVFDCDFDEKTFEAIQELRIVRKSVLSQQIGDINQTLSSLVQMGAISSSERQTHQHLVLDELREKLSLVEERLLTPNVIHSDELELYLNLLSEPT